MLNKACYLIAKKYRYLVFLGIAFMSAPAWADLPWDNTLQKAVDDLTTRTAHLMILAAIALTGIGFAIGEHGGWLRKSMAVAMGASIACGAASIAAQFGWI